MFYVKIRFFDSDQGGRNTPPLSGYGPQIKIGTVYTSCLLTADSDDYIFSFGQEHEAILELRFPEVYPKVFQIGDTFEFFEGPKCVGYGRIMGS